jgi:hypothetical protein
VVSGSVENGGALASASREFHQERSVVDLGFSLKHNRYLLVINLLGIGSATRSPIATKHDTKHHELVENR